MRKVATAEAPTAPVTSEAEVDRLVKTGAITSEMAKHIKSSIRKDKPPPSEVIAPPPAPVMSEAEVDRLVKTGAITSEMAKHIKSSIRKGPKDKPSEAEVDTLV